jgi:hypothetical protein
LQSCRDHVDKRGQRFFRISPVQIRFFRNC